MEQQPSFDPHEPGGRAERTERRLAFLKGLGRALAVSLVGSALYALLIGPRSLTGFADGLFLAGAILFAIGLMPLIGDIYGRATATLTAEERKFEDILEEQRTRRQRTGSGSYLYGVAGVIAIALSLIVSFSVQ
jgi:hypothetical protein